MPDTSYREENGAQRRTPAVKICGITALEETACINALKPEYVGFVFAPSRRRITREHAITLRMSLDPAVRVVGVFVDELPRIAGAYAEDGIIDLIQLHGHEDEVYIRNLRNQTGCEIIQAFSMKDKEDAKRANASKADYILLDHGAGGSGKCFDWNLTKLVRRPYFLAGGLTPENVAEAARLHPFALDISSGAETNGKKDGQKLEACIRRIRNG